MSGACGDPASALRAAVEASLGGAYRARIDSEVAVGGVRQPSRVVMEHVPPDRYRFDADGVPIVRVGERVMVRGPGGWRAMPGGLASLLPTAHELLRASLARGDALVLPLADEVHGGVERQAYRVDQPSDPARTALVTGKVLVHAGRLHFMETDHTNDAQHLHGTTRFEYDPEYDPSINIELPAE